jgi:cation transport regulator ChaC
MQLYVFGYGSLMNPMSLARTLPREHTFHPAVLPGYKRRMNLRYKEHVFLNIVPREDSKVDGLLIPITHDELELLKRREEGYDCVDITALLEDTVDGIAYTFIAPDVAYCDLTIKRSYILRCLGGVAPERRGEWLADTIIENEIDEDVSDDA